MSCSLTLITVVWVASKLIILSGVSQYYHSYIDIIYQAYHLHYTRLEGHREMHQLHYEIHLNQMNLLS
jgi:hypothetical protein